MLPSALSLATAYGCVSLLSKEEAWKAKLVVDGVSGSLKLQELEGLPLCEDVLH